jgi:hypothetical protein
MRRIAAFTAVALLMGTVGLAVADDSTTASAREPVTPLISLDAMTQKIDALGYDVDRLKVDHGRFEARIVDRQTGGVVEAIFSMTTGELVRAKLGS